MMRVLVVIARVTVCDECDMTRGVCFVAGSVEMACV